ncbi:MAG: Ni/Fe hydrogenase subunit gamma [Gammaproteobacteria bacterium]|nr:MAG: Ni/Fe hydrogenase subunit gamma [Gammaproteobacteria bacterium]
MDLPRVARVAERVQETPSIVTLRLALEDGAPYAFAPGQFNMLHLPGVGEVPISLSSDPEHDRLLGHTVRAVGRVTRALARLPVGARLGVRGPFGRGWPLAAARGRDVVVLTGGLGCAPVVAAVRYVLRRRAAFGRLVILQGVKHAEDLLWREQYQAWARAPDTQVLLAADVAGGDWPWAQGPVLELLDQARFRPEACTVMMCGPEPMMVAACRRLEAMGVPREAVFLSMERNMQCARGLCGHCQLGPFFVCRDGPVFRYDAIAPLLGRRGF